VNPTNKNNGTPGRTLPWRHALLALAAHGLVFASAAFAGSATPDSIVKAPDAAAAADYTFAGKVAAGPRDVAPSLRMPLTRLKVKSSSVMVIDAEDSSVLYSKHADVAMPIASISKLMTALVALEANQPMDEYLEITEDDRDTEKGTTSRLTPGTELTRRDMLHLALMASENRAANAIGRNYPGGLAAFIPAMNAKARELGMTSAHFVEPTGLSSQNVSSAADLIKLVTAASRNPTIREYSTYQSYAVPVGRQLIEFRNTNSLVSKSGWDIALQKTGYTVDAGRCLVMKALIQDREVVMVLLHSVGKYTRVADAGRIKKWMEGSTGLRTASVLRSQNLN
jgi:D-alanyl-D-alanine endopeptidase (penicillin-binding protein 7)